MLRAPYIQFIVALSVTTATALAAPIGYAINFSGQFGTSRYALHSCSPNRLWFSR